MEQTYTYTLLLNQTDQHLHHVASVIEHARDALRDNDLQRLVGIMRGIGEHLGEMQSLVNAVSALGEMQSLVNAVSDVAKVW